MTTNRWPLGFLFLLISGIICYVISMANPQFDKMEMAGMIIVFGPAFSTLAAMIIFLLIALVTKKRNWFTVSLALCILNILWGVYLNKLE